jgi:hypothetical protein
MPFDLHYLEERRFMRTVVHGALDDEQLMRHVDELNRRTRGADDLREFADARGLTDMDALTVSGTTLAAAHEVPRLKSRLAIVIENTPLLIGLARAYQAFAQQQRGSVEIFHDPDAALGWLAEGHDDLPVLQRFVADRDSA